MLLGRVLLLVVVAVMSTLALVASPLSWCQLSTRNGLLQNTVYAITGDSKGFVWLGTAEGLCRYDGHFFKTFSDSPLVNHSIYDLCFLNDTLLQVAGDKGLEVFNTHSFSSVVVTRMPFRWGGVHLAPARHGNAFCVVDNEGVFKLTADKQGYRFTCIATCTWLQNSSAVTYDNKLLVFARGNSTYLEGNDAGFAARKLPYPVESNPVLTGQGNMVFLTTQPGRTYLCQYNLGTNAVVSLAAITLSPNNMFSRQMSYDRWSKKLYLTDRQYGLVIIDSSLHVEASLPGEYMGMHASHDNVFLTNTVIGHTLWLTADVEGVFFANLLGAQFAHYKERNAASTIIKGIYADKQNNVYGGVLLDSFRQFTPYGLSAGATRYNCRHYPKLDAFNSIEPVGDRVLIYSRYFFGYIPVAGGNTSDLTDQLIKVLPQGTGRNSYYEARTIDYNEGLLSYENHLFHFVAGNEKLILNKQHTLPNSITAIGIIDSNNYFVGTEKGLWHYHENSITEVPKFADYYIKHINVSTAALCVSTSSGLFLADRDGRVIKSWSMQNHKLLNNTIYGAWRSKNDIWGSCNAGLFHIDLERDTVFHYTAEDGVQDNEFNSKAFCFANDRVLFGGVNGINEILPLHMWFRLSRLNAYVAGLRVNDQVWTAFNEQQHTIDLNYRQNTIDIKFAAIAPSMSKFLKYQYRLNGLESNFHSADGALTARYIALPPGEHIFEVRICGFEQSIVKQLLTIRIAPPYWQTVWFRALILIAIAVTIYLAATVYFRQKERKMRAEIESLTKIQKERERISRDLHDNAGSLVTYMLMQLDSENAAETRTTELKHAARTLMNTLRETIWTLAEHPITNYEFCDKLITYAQKYVPVEVTFTRQLEKEQLLPKESVLNMYRICQEAFNNILKHSKASHVVVYMQSDDRYRMKIEIADNGVGFDTRHQMEDTHLGMRNMLNRSKEAGLEVTVVSTPGKGTSITIILGNGH